MNEGGISDVDVNRKMLKFVNNAYSEYFKQLEEQETSGKKKRTEKRKVPKWTKESKGSKAEVRRTT